MTADQWLASDDPEEMLVFLETTGRASGRKLRLVMAACCRRIWPLLTDARSRAAVEAAERHADGLLGDDALDRAREAAWAPFTEGFLAGEYRTAVYAAAAATEDPESGYAFVAACAKNAARAWAGLPFVQEDLRPAAAERAGQAALLRCVLGPLPFRPVSVAPAWRAWNGGTAVNLAAAIAAERALPAGTLDPTRLPVLADALEAAGADDPDLLAHLRDGGPHVHGCWCIELLLGKE